jgi:hypothetical protein
MGKTQSGPRFGGLRPVNINETQSATILMVTSKRSTQGYSGLG